MGRFLLLMLCAAAIFAAPASAQSCKAPPGMSAIDQYCEAIPGPSGDRGNTDADRGGVAIPAQTQRALARHGVDGQAIIALSQASQRQAGNGGATGSAPATPHGPVTVTPDSPAQNPISAIASGFGQTGDTVSPAFGTLLLLFALVFFSVAWLRYRRRAQG